jgi:hypothetical protein
VIEADGYEKSTLEYYGFSGDSEINFTLKKVGQ